jgi:hypothetical protein
MFVTEDYIKAVLDQRLREGREAARTRRLLEPSDPPSAPAVPCSEPVGSYSDLWRARAPRATSTTR